ncbi:MAG: HAMP domain-containing sensor histidine kinase, partial [Eubacteriales bacterium]|nr:HAMP domain-containing sensor histidine kinase [Eubacteriales bacterium]
MSVEKKKWRSRLTLELILMCAVALAAAFLTARIAENASLQWALERAYTEENYEKQTSDTLANLQAFIEDKKVTEDNIELLIGWVQKQRDVYVMFYRDVDTLLGPYMTESFDDSEEPVVETIYETTYYDLQLYDGTPIKVELECYLDVRYMYWVDIAMYASGAVVFVLVLFLLIHSKIRYINRLEQELKVLGAGNLEYPITIRGNDEITTLARGIQALKNGVLEEQQMKAEAEKANMELVTAMSHDLRTPLTSLIGYLELLNMRRYENEEQLGKYLEYCRRKAFQMKKVSDRLFEYFLVYGREEKGLQLRSLSSEELVEDLCNGQLFDWQDQGGTIDCQIEELSGSVQVDSEYMQRVMDNLVSNLRKYGDPAKPLLVRARERKDMLHILVTNYVRDKENRIESTQIGLKTCRKIIANHGG